MGTIARLAELDIALPPASAPVGSYVPARMGGGGLIFCAGHLGRRGGSVVTGHIGPDLDISSARALARLTALDLLASAAALVGDADRITGVVRVTGMMRSVEGFTEQPTVLNGASDLYVEIFGDRGRHARSAMGVSELPLGAALEIEAIFEAHMED